MSQRPTPPCRRSDQNFTASFSSRSAGPTPVRPRCVGPAAAFPVRRQRLALADGLRRRLSWHSRARQGGRSAGGARGGGGTEEALAPLRVVCIKRDDTRQPRRQLRFAGQVGGGLQVAVQSPRHIRAGPTASRSGRMRVGVGCGAGGGGGDVDGYGVAPGTVMAGGGVRPALIVRPVPLRLRSDAAGGGLPPGHPEAAQRRFARLALAGR
mmetsp:Transcript_7435/g.24416  ORF Transcript_7435/g.24416 Transcript_7435/m.24416 type:complete len:210 (-) Transcript_7435:901-1530(-)|eukprot:scaffold80_cov106-Isochrysis_galbana.AAC.6